MEVGIIDWFNEDKGFGVLKTSGYKEVFLHHSEIRGLNIDFEKSNVFKFEIERKRNKDSATNVGLLKGYEDFDLLMSEFDEYSNEDRFFMYALKSFFKSHEPTIILDYFKRFYDDYIKEGQKPFLKEFLRVLFRLLDSLIKDDQFVLFEDKLRDEYYVPPGSIERLENFLETGDMEEVEPVKAAEDELSEEKINEVVSYFFENVSSEFLFPIWKTGRFKYRSPNASVSLNDNSSEESGFRFGDELFIKNWKEIGRKEFKRLNQSGYSNQLLKEILLKKIHEITNFNESVFKEILEILEVAEFNKEDKEILFDEFTNKLTALSLDFLIPKVIDLEKKRNQFRDDFNIIINALKTRSNGQFYKKFVDSINGALGQEDVFKLWRLTDYFEPDYEFYLENLSRLSPDELKNAPLEIHRQFVDTKLSNIGAIDSISKFGLVVMFISETPFKVLNQILKELSDEYKFVLLLALRRLKDRGYHSQDNFTIECNAQYENEDISISDELIESFLEEKENSKEIFLPFALIYEINSQYSQNWSQSGPFGELGDIVKRTEAIEEILADITINYKELLAGILSRLSKGQVEIFFQVLVPKYLNRQLISLDEIKKSIYQAELYQESRDAIFNYLAGIVKLEEKAILWIEDEIETMAIPEALVSFKRINPEYQLQLFKRIFKELQKHSSDIEKYKKLIIHIGTLPNIQFDVRIITEVLKSLEKSDSYPRQNVISEVICSYLNEDLEALLNVDEVFEKCPGRLWKTYNPETEKYWFANILGKDFPVVDDEVYIGGESYYMDKDNRKVYIGREVLPFKWRSKESQIYSRLYEIPDGIKFCEGRKSVIDEELEEQFHWCCNAKCYGAKQDDHISIEWKYYTLRDFIKILKLPFIAELYYRFVGQMNRVERLMKKLKCKSCNKLMRDAMTSDFAFYRTTVYHCTNRECSELHNKVYLNHCFNWRCNNIIDSRISKTCPNGWYICDKCDYCCSHDKNVKRLENLKENKALVPTNPRHQKLIYQVQNKLGHLERGETFDFKTGQPKN